MRAESGFISLGRQQIASSYKKDAYFANQLAFASSTLDMSSCPSSLELSKVVKSGSLRFVRSEAIAERKKKAQSHRGGPNTRDV